MPARTDSIQEVFRRRCSTRIAVFQRNWIRLNVHAGQHLEIFENFILVLPGVQIDPGGFIRTFLPRVPRRGTVSRWPRRRIVSRRSRRRIVPRRSGRTEVSWRSPWRSLVSGTVRHALRGFNDDFRPHQALRSPQDILEKLFPILEYVYRMLEHSD